jgi:methyl-accepting chemotaxis protein
MRLTLRAALVAAFVALLVLLLAVGLVGVFEAGRINDRNSATYEDDLVGTGQVAALSQDLMDVREAVLAHILAPDAARKAAIEADIVRADQGIAAAAEQIRVGDTDGQQRDELAQFDQAWASYQRARDGATLPASRAGDSTAALSSYSGEEGARFDTAGRAVDALITSKAESARADHATNIGIYENARRLILIATVLAVIIGVGVVLALRRAIARLTGSLRAGSQDLAAAGAEIVAAAAQQAAGATEQSAAIAETTATVGQVRASAEQAEAMAQLVTSRADEASRVAEEGVAAQVRAILSDIQRATNAAVMATEQGTKGADAGIRTIDRAGRTIDELAGAIRQAAGSAAQITASVRQHAVGMEQIAAAMASINSATAQSLSAVTNTRESAENLTDLAGRLNSLTVQYQI